MAPPSAPETFAQRLRTISGVRLIVEPTTTSDRCTDSNERAPAELARTASFITSDSPSLGSTEVIAYDPDGTPSIWPPAVPLRFSAPTGRPPSGCAPPFSGP